MPTSAVDDAHARVGPDTVAKILFTSGSTGMPKGVINTQRMLCSNQEMILTALPLLAEQPPILCDWLPWNHTFGGNHNFGIVLYNGGTLYIDEGKPTAADFDKTIANLAEIATTAYFNVPRGYDLLVPRLANDPAFARHFFSRLEMLFCAAASLRQDVADELIRLANEARDGAAHSVRDGAWRDGERTVRALCRRCGVHRRANRRAGARRGIESRAGR